LINLGFAYEILACYAIALGQYWNTFSRLEPEQLSMDLAGLSIVAVWMFLYTVLVPARPRRVLVALLGCAAAVPLTYLWLVWIGNAPALGVSQFVGVFVVPYLIVVAMAYIAARIIYRLGQDVSKAREMGAYRLEERLGAGGMGEVWRASHRMLARPAAIKLINPRVLGTDPGTIEAATIRFEREAQVTAGLRSPHTVELYDFGVADNGELYYVMELLDGVDLDTLVRTYGPLPAERVIHLLEQACASLAEAHWHGLVHRDIKPANIYVCRQGLVTDVVKVLDFGLVKRQTVDASDPQLTRADVVAGTPSYIAPEVVLGSETVDGRADLYALGCVAFWLLTGRLVFEEATVPATIAAHVHKTPQAPSARAEVTIPQALDSLVLQCLAKDPAERPASAEVLGKELAAIPLAEPWTKERALRWWEAHGLHQRRDALPLGGLSPRPA
jgi:serine/threonine-protein kinase